MPGGTFTHAPLSVHRSIRGQEGLERHCRSFQTIVRPPLTLTVYPVMNAASSET